MIGVKRRILTIFAALFIAVISAAGKAGEAMDTTSYIKGLTVAAQEALAKGEEGRAVALYGDALELADMGECLFMLSSSLYNVAQVYYQNGEYEKALEYARKSLEIEGPEANDSVVILRRFLTAQILFEMQRYDEAIEQISGGLKTAINMNNWNMAGRHLLLRTRCFEAMSGDSPDWNQVTAGYKEAYDMISANWSQHVSKNPYLAEICYYLGRAMYRNGDDGSRYLEEGIRHIEASKRKRGQNPLLAIKIYTLLSEEMASAGNQLQADEYAALADRLSYVPYLVDLGGDISLSQIEFIRREKDRQIQKQKTVSQYMSAAVLLLVIILVVILMLYRRVNSQKKAIESKNAQLIKLGLQKDKLIAIINSQLSQQKESENVMNIAMDEIPMPEVKLSGREIEILRYCCQGLLSKEIAAQTGISVRTVETHKLNIFRKIGVNTTSELVAYAYKSGTVK